MSDTVDVIETESEHSIVIDTAPVEEPTPTDPTIGNIQTDPVPVETTTQAPQVVPKPTETTTKAPETEPKPVETTAKP